MSFRAGRQRRDGRVTASASLAGVLKGEAGHRATTRNAATTASSGLRACGGTAAEVSWSCSPPRAVRRDRTTFVASHQASPRPVRRRRTRASRAGAGGPADLRDAPALDSADASLQMCGDFLPGIEAVVERRLGGGGMSSEERCCQGVWHGLGRQHLSHPPPQDKCRKARHERVTHFAACGRFPQRVNRCRRRIVVRAWTDQPTRKGARSCK